MTKTTTELFISKRADSSPLDVASVPEEGLRVYRNSPSDLIVQIRTKTAKQGRMANVHLSAAEARHLAAYLNKIARELEN